MIPTGWYPNSISISSDGTWAYVVNSKSPTGPNINWCYVYGPTGYPTCMPANEYNPQMTKAGLLSFPLTGLTTQLPALTATGRCRITTSPPWRALPLPPPWRLCIAAFST